MRCIAEACRGLAAALLLASCAGPDDAGHAVGRALYDASVSTGHALAVATDRTGQALQGAGTGLRDAASPPPPAPAAMPALPPPYVPDGFPPTSTTRPDPAMGY